MTRQRAAGKTVAKTVGDLADLFRVTDKTVRDWIRQGLPTEKEGGKGRGNGALVDLEAAVRWYLEYIELDAEKIRVAREQADKLALENAVTRGDLVPVSVWQKELEAFLGEIRAALLGLGAKLAPVMDGNANQRKERIDRAVFEILGELASYQPGERSGHRAKSVRRRRAGSAAAAEANR